MPHEEHHGHWAHHQQEDQQEPDDQGDEQQEREQEREDAAGRAAAAPSAAAHALPEGQAPVAPDPGEGVQRPHAGELPDHPGQVEDVVLARHAQQREVVCDHGQPQPHCEVQENDGVELQHVAAAFDVFPDGDAQVPLHVMERHVYLQARCVGRHGGLAGVLLYVCARLQPVPHPVLPQVLLPPRLRLVPQRPLAEAQDFLVGRQGEVEVAHVGLHHKSVDRDTSRGGEEAVEHHLGP
mmetsp:Transcript_99985/g.282985  ORF Transcript_99985/g.282985 Transcript_99985/m.282985 type:complete len:238 (+) Transcript_99985:1140-1853(+)